MMLSLNYIKEIIDEFIHNFACLKIFKIRNQFYYKIYITY